MANHEKREMGSTYENPIRTPVSTNISTMINLRNRNSMNTISGLVSFGIL